VLAGTQAMTIYKPIPIEANTAAETAVALLNGTSVAKTTTYQGVKSFIFNPIVVTKDKVKDTVIKDKFYKASDICNSSYAAACKAAGIS
jgi:D-xylose transport system substrate-binding protein